MSQPERYHVIGMMSGTSLDGIDMASCEFYKEDGKWRFDLKATETILYSDEWKRTLAGTFSANSRDLIRIDHSFGKYCGELCRNFIDKNDLNPNLVASHGHTVFHAPAEYSLQIGNGNDIAAATGLPVVYDFRSLDISLGGQGAPLVPVGDKLLFSDFEICLNLGGFSNISFDEGNLRVAYDICPVNIVLNEISAELSMPFDKNGETGRNGKINNALLQQLNDLAYYKERPPKSLGKEFVQSQFMPLVNSSHIKPVDKLRSCYEHISGMIAENLNRTAKKNALLTGGGAKNLFLTELIRQKTNADIVIPEENIIDFKEAIIFAFLGLLRIQGRINCLASATGASRDCSGGVVAEPGPGIYH